MNKNLCHYERLRLYLDTAEFVLRYVVTFVLETAVSELELYKVQRLANRAP